MTFIPGLKGAVQALNYRRPVLKWTSASTVDIENNTGTANDTKIIFPDGELRDVTEDTGSTNKFRRFDITATAEFTSGTEDSGLRSGESEANNTWYGLYAVKSLIDSSKFVTVGTATLPLQANVSTLNSNFNTNGWAYLGLIRNGNSQNNDTDILGFTMAGNETHFLPPAMASLFEAQVGVLLANASTGTSITYTYSAGTGDLQIPNNIGIAHWTFVNGVVGQDVTIGVSGATHNLDRYHPSAFSDQLIGRLSHPATEGLVIAHVSGDEVKSLVLAGFTDIALGVGGNPLI